MARLRHPPKRVTGSNSRSSRPQRSEPEKKIRLARKRGKLLRRWGSVVMGQVGPNVKMNVKCKPTSNVADVHRCSFSPVGFDPHPCQADSKSGTAPTVQLAHPTNCNLSQRTTFECATPAQRGIEWLTDCRPHAKCIRVLCPQQFAEASWNA